MDEQELDVKYKEFIQTIVSQVVEILPDDINELQKNYLTSNIIKSATLMAISEQENEEFKVLDFEEQCFYIQIIAEWSFHKEIDLFRSGIPAKYWKTVMQKIWYTMWEVMYACIKNDASHTVVLTLVERFVNRTYNDAVEELKEEHLIDEYIEEQAKEQSNIDKMAEEIKIVEELRSTIHLWIKRIILAIIIAIVVTVLIKTLNTTGIIIVLSLLAIFNILQIKQ